MYFFITFFSYLLYLVYFLLIDFLGDATAFLGDTFRLGALGADLVVEEPPPPCFIAFTTLGFFEVLSGSGIYVSPWIRSRPPPIVAILDSNSHFEFTQLTFFILLY